MTFFKLTNKKFVKSSSSIYKSEIGVQNLESFLVNLNYKISFTTLQFKDHTRLRFLTKEDKTFQENINTKAHGKIPESCLNSTYIRSLRTRGNLYITETVSMFYYFFKAGEYTIVPISADRDRQLFVIG